MGSRAVRRQTTWTRRVAAAAVIRDSILALSSLLGAHHRTENFHQGQELVRELVPRQWRREGVLAVAEALPQTPGISAPSVGILVTVGARTTPASSDLLLHQNSQKILGSFQWLQGLPQRAPGGWLRCQWWSRADHSGGPHQALELEGALPGSKLPRRSGSPWGQRHLDLVSPSVHEAWRVFLF